MKKNILTLALVALSTSALAAESAPKSMTETCEQLAELARTTMEARQVGVPMRQMMVVAEGTIMADMLTEAYSSPAYSTQKYQDRAIQEFEDRWYLGCVKAYNR